MADAERSRRLQHHPAGMALRVVLAGMLLMAGSAAAAPSPVSDPPVDDLDYAGQPEHDPPVTAHGTLAKVQEPPCRLMHELPRTPGPATEPREDVTQRVCTPLLSQPGVTRPPVDPQDPEATLWWAHGTIDMVQAEAEAIAASGQEQAESLADQAQGLPDAAQERAERLPEQAGSRVDELAEGINATAGEAQAQAGAAQEEAERTVEDPQGGVHRATDAAKGLAEDVVRVAKGLWPF